ncbi:hypothetical protein [Rhodopirellula baltica]|uniref:Leucine Rich repeats (2 copies) n=1 Tax=Rhodopirellula baltica (strain DSM 10527 / NCIMB 13988 / SH1) TaxID=243090 RepID=Q7UIL5_RHOBA|nr:hypothetical protein [Rhodopirellula baltica]CAD77599.1 hypothetical protein RB12454 [Rhodopirellula baltica SH 1]
MLNKPAQRHHKSSDFDPHPGDREGVRALANRCRFQLDGRGRVWGVWIHVEFSDSEVEHLLQLPRLISVSFGASIRHTPALTEHGFAQLAKHRLLSGFFFQGNIQLNDSAIATIRDFPRLAHLMLPFCGVTDAGVRNLAIADRFFTLSLVGNSITDDSVPHLCRLKSLRRLWVGKTSISSFGYDELKAALPRCRTLNDVL